MAMYRPIKKRILIHEIEYREKVSDDFMGTQYRDGIIVSNVRVEPKDKISQNGTDKSVVANHLIFIDMFYTKPEYITSLIKAEDKILFAGKELEVVEVREIYDGSRLHHLEIWCQG